MIGGRCQRQKMMGRGAEGGCGTEEKPCPVSRVSVSCCPTTSTTTKPGVDLYAQARKALSEHSPFDSEDAFARVSTLPVGLATSLLKHSDGHRKHKKAQPEPVKNPQPTQPAPVASNVWQETEEYFRPISWADIDKLIPRLSDSCLTIPLPRSVAGHETKNETVLIAVEESSDLAQAVLAGEEVETVVQEAVVQEVEEKVEVEQQEMEIEEVGARDTDGDISPDRRSDSEGNSSMNWVLGSKNRVLLASERPSKKRRLLGGDASLERLLSLPHLQGDDSLPFCDYCCCGDSGVQSNMFLHCNSCKVSVHQKCYGAHEVPVGPWLCCWCRQSESAKGSISKDGEGRPCSLCPKGGGALKPVGAEGCQRGASVKFAHLFCSFWMPEVYVDNIEVMEPIMNVGGVQETRKKLVCYLCKVKHGACIRCSHGTCRTSFHPICARASKHRMEIWGTVGCDYVELRAFCSKHSVFQDMGFAQHPENLTMPSLATNSLPMTSSMNKFPKIRFTRKNRDRITGEEKTSNSGFGTVDKNDMPLEHEVLAVRKQPESGSKVIENTESAGVTESCDAVDENLSDIHDLVRIMKKLTDRGKIKVVDVASDMGISSDILEAALVGDSTSLPPELRLKIIKWLQESVHLGTLLQHLNSRTGHTLSPAANVAVSDGLNAKVAGSFGRNGVKAADLGVSDAVVVKSLPPRRRTKSNIRILKDNKILCSSGKAFVKQNCNGKLIDENGESTRLLGEDMKDATCNGSSFHDQGCCERDQEVLVKKLEDASQYSEQSSFQQHPGDNGIPMIMENKNAADKGHPQQPFTERVPSFGSGIEQEDEGEANNTVQLKLTSHKSRQEHSDCDDKIITDIPQLGICEPCSASYVHPFIQKRLTQMPNCFTLRPNIIEADSNGQMDKGFSSMEANSFSRNSSHHTWHSCTGTNHGLDTTTMEQLVKAEDMGILELSPEDEVDGEILYLQNRLLDNAVAVKHRYEDLIFRAVRHLPQELDFLKKQRWDLVVVNQFLRQVREAKKRGRREKWHKEFQAVLAAVNAAVATSSRILRKDTNDETASAHQESPVRVEAAGVRAGSHSPLVRQAKESLSKLAVVKNPSEKNHGTSGPLCDICGRYETMLNRIFVCGGCKVAVHLDCYRKPKDPISSWHCELCEELQSQSRSHQIPTMDYRERPCFVTQCCFCGAVTGAFRKSADGQWVHAFCAEWVLESTYRRGQENAVEGMDAISKEKDVLSCCVCHQKTGFCMKCSYGHCQVAFHPYCARSVGLYMCVKNISGKLQHKAYCEKHSSEQREKADAQQYGAEELKSIRQIRVELEKVRLLCERIIRREKLKRELVLCSHDIHSSKRDYAAFSLLVRSPLFPHGVSSDSATTSIDRSYSDAIQRSDEITVESSVSGKRKVRLPLQMETDRRTDDSSTSRLPSSRKAADRVSFSGKQIPHRPASMASHNTVDGEKRSKPRKHTETFQKELVMTSDQASIQNKRLPKGFVYVPVDCLSKTRDIESREAREPNG